MTGHPLAAAGMNLLLALLILAGLLLAAMYLLRRGYMASKVLRSPILSWIIFAVVILFTVARNLPWEPFRLLAPGATFGQ